MWIWITLAAIVVLMAGQDLLQRRHAIRRNFPIIGRFRYWLETIGPELRQYIVTSNDEERPFNRDQRRWVYASSKHENNYFGFGTDDDLEQAANHIIIEHSAFPLVDAAGGESQPDGGFSLPAARELGSARGRARAFRPASIINISAMSYGSLSARAVESMSRGALAAGCLQNTGEGGISPHHRHGGDLVWQIGTGYFGCRNEQGGFSMERLLETVQAHPGVRAIEIKFSQGAKPGLGGILPAAKVTQEIASIRGIPVGQACVSPPCHSAFSDVDSLLDLVEDIADRTGMPVGIKSAVGQMDFWHDLARLMGRDERGVDFITIDGGEGGTGAAPLVFTDHVALPFKLAVSRVIPMFIEAGARDRVAFIGSGKLGFPEDALLAIALGCDVINVAREAMLAIGCIQAQRCHTGHCPTGVATQNRWLARGLDPALKAARLANYVATMRKELVRLSHACGVSHPALVTLDRLSILNDRFRATPAREVFGYAPGWGELGPSAQAAIRALMEASPGQ